MTSEPYRLLICHNHWANGVLLDRCAQLTDEQFNRRFPIGLGSLHDTMNHIIGCLEAWMTRVHGGKPERSPRPQAVEQFRSRNDASTRAVTELIEHLKQTNTIDRRCVATFESTTGGQVEFHFTASSGLVHALVHGTHHRAQALNMLRHLNLGQPLPELDISDWQYEVENGKSG